VAQRPFWLSFEFSLEKRSSIIGKTKSAVKCIGSFLLHVLEILTPLVSETILTITNSMEFLSVLVVGSVYPPRCKVSCLGPDRIVAQQALFFTIVSFVVDRELQGNIAPDVRVLPKRSAPFAVRSLGFEAIQRLHERPSV